MAPGSRQGRREVSEAHANGIWLANLLRICDLIILPEVPDLERPRHKRGRVFYKSYPAQHTVLAKLYLIAVAEFGLLYTVAVYACSVGAFIVGQDKTVRRGLDKCVLL